MKPNQRLRYEREQRGWSQARVAEQIDTDAVNVSRWERGFSSPSPFFREKLCKLFDKSAQDLGFLTGENLVDKKESPEEELSVASSRPHQQALADPQPLLPSRHSRILAGLSYLLWWLTGLPMLLFNDEDYFILFHSLQSVLFFGSISILYTACIWLMASPFSDSVEIFVVFFFIVLSIVAWPAWIICMVRAFMGICSKLPLIGDTSEKLARAMIQRHGERSKV